MAWVCREGSIHSLCWGKLLKAVPGLLTIGNVGKVKGRVLWAERTTSSNAPAGESACCVWGGGGGWMGNGCLISKLQASELEIPGHRSSGAEESAPRN